MLLSISCAQSLNIRTEPEGKAHGTPAPKKKTTVQLDEREVKKGNGDFSLPHLFSSLLSLSLQVKEGDEDNKSNIT